MGGLSDPNNSFGIGEGGYVNTSMFQGGDSITDYQASYVPQKRRGLPNKSMRMTNRKTREHYEQKVYQMVDDEQLDEDQCIVNNWTDEF